MDSFRPLKTGLVSNKSVLTLTPLIISKFPSPENGVSFKLDQASEFEYRLLIKFPSPENGVSFKQRALKPAPLLG